FELLPLFVLPPKIIEPRPLLPLWQATDFCRPLQAGAVAMFFDNFGFVSHRRVSLIRILRLHAKRAAVMTPSRLIALLCLVAGTVGLCGEPATPGEAKKAAVDAFCDPLPAGALARLGTLRFQQGAAVQMLRYSADGKVLASLGADEVIRL